MKRRWYNIFRPDNRSLILAMDHAMIMDVSELGLRDPSEVLRKAVKGGVDAVLTTFGVAKTFQHEIGNKGLILRTDGGLTEILDAEHQRGYFYPTFSVEDAVRVGADGVMCMGFPGIEDEEKIIANLAHVASECEKWGLVFGAEMIPGGFGKKELHNLKNLGFASRLGAEYGADFIKSPFLGDEKSFRSVLDNCYKPVLVLGGGGQMNDEELLTMVRRAMNAGAAGVTIGRNIWRHKNVDKLCASLGAIIHDDVSVDEALKIL